MRSRYLIPVSALLLSLLLWSSAYTLNPSPFIDPPLADAEVVNAQVAYPPYEKPIVANSLDVIGDTATIGTTWYDLQHFGTIGRQMVMDDEGYLHFVWMNGLNYGGIERHVYYNVIDPTGIPVWPGSGYPVESSYRAGYATLDLGYGNRAFPAFHQKMTSGSSAYHTAVAADFFPHYGAFLTWEPGWLYVHGEDTSTLYPNISIDRNGRIHIISTVTMFPDPIDWHVYTVGEYDPVTFTITFPPPPHTWTKVGRTTVDGADVTSSDVSDRVAAAWITPHHDIMVLIDEDGQELNFGEAFNLTRFILPDPSLLPDTLLANRDTLRAHDDLTLLFDQDDWLHIAFTTRSYFFYQATCYWNASIIWHWSEQYPDEFSVVANAWHPEDLVECGPGCVKAQRPSLGQDPVTGHLYCMYQYYDTDTTALSAAGWPSGEVYVSVSTDGGLNWAVGTNVTETITPQNAPPGQCYSEECPCMAEWVDGDCHIMYTMDYDAGYVIQNAGTWTLNDVKYHHVPVDSIPTTPLVPQVPFHVSPIHINQEITAATGTIESLEICATPNPFNPQTAIKFSLPDAVYVTLKVYDLQGRLVATLADGLMNAGSHDLIFDGSNLASGVYLYRLQADKFTTEAKLVLVK